MPEKCTVWSLRGRKECLLGYVFPISSTCDCSVETAKLGGKAEVKECGKRTPKGLHIWLGVPLVFLDHMASYKSP